MGTDIENNIGLYEIAFNGADKGLEVKQFNEKDGIIDGTMEPVAEINVMDANEQMVPREVLHRVETRKTQYALDVMRGREQDNQRDDLE